MYCTQCNSGEIRKLSLVFESGLSHTSSRTTGVGFGLGGGLGIGSARTHGTAVTATAAKAAPPQRRPLTWPIISLIVFGLWGLAPHAQAMFVLAAIAAIIVFNRHRLNTQVWPGLYDTWDRSYLCERCGSMMIPAMQPPQAVTQTPPPPVQTIDHDALPRGESATENA